MTTLAPPPAALEPCAGAGDGVAGAILTLHSTTDAACAEATLMRLFEIYSKEKTDGADDLFLVDFPS